MRTLCVLVCLTVFVSAAVCAQTQGQATQSNPAGSTMQSMPEQRSHMSMSNAAEKLHQDMRKLWTDHVVYTRDFIIAATENNADVPAVTDRLMRNQEDIGNAVSMFYGVSAGNQLTSLLKQHIQIAGDLVKAAVAKDDGKKQKADQQWHQNAQQIAMFLSQANPNWPQSTLTDMMTVHLQTTSDELQARLNKDWSADVRAFDAVYNHILKMSDALSDGIINNSQTSFL